MIPELGYKHLQRGSQKGKEGGLVTSTSYRLMNLPSNYARAVIEQGKMGAADWKWLVFQGDYWRQKAWKSKSESSVERRGEEQGGLTAGGGSAMDENPSAVQLGVPG